MVLPQCMALLDSPEAQLEVPLLLMVLLRRHPELRQFVCNAQLAQPLAVLCQRTQLSPAVQVGPLPVQTCTSAGLRDACRWLASSP